MDSFPKRKRPSLLKELLRSKSGIAGIVIIVILFGLTIYSIFGLPANLSLEWQNGQAWVLNPIDAPPTWVGIFGINTAPTLNVILTNWQEQTLSAGPSNFYEYSSSSSFHWGTGDMPQDLAFVPQFQGHPSTATITFAKPQGKSIQIQLSQPGANQAFEAQSQQFTTGAAQYLLSQTGQYSAQLQKKDVVSAFFGQPGKDILNSSAISGNYEVSVVIISSSPLNMSNSDFVVLGNSYGAMGTDNQGRPIDIGILAGLPNALEVGFLVAILSVVSGILFGGISGYFGARKDSVLQWFALVFLALPALPFLVAMSYSVKLSLEIEILLIAALSWPFYAIIARTVALSVKSQTFVEADKAMGIPSYRVFFSHFMPRLVPVTVAYTVLGIPGGILLAETLSFIGIIPPNLITWGGILDDAFVSQAAVFGFWWWVVFPGLMIVISAIPFVLIGFSLERIIAPRVAVK
ncbi:MAG: ABC transporter permease [Nitrososphaerales archaeon]